MPVTWRKSTNDYSIIVWKSTEPIETLLENASLNQNEISEWNSFQSHSRKREWLTVRNALQILLPGANSSIIYYDGNGKPHLKEDGFISISHSHEYIAVMKSNFSEIGVDVENINPRIVKLSQKFLNGYEKENINPENQLEKLHVFWGAKEVLFKIHSIGNVDFKKDLLVHPFIYNDSGTLNASIQKKGFVKKYKICYEKIDHYMLTWSAGQTL